MTVTKYYQAANGKVAKVVQAGNDLTPEEEGRLRKALGNYSLLDGDPVKTENIKGEKKLFTPTGKFVGADYKTGIKDSSFRSRLITLDNNEERTKYSCLILITGFHFYLIRKLSIYQIIQVYNPNTQSILKMVIYFNL